MVNATIQASTSTAQGANPATETTVIVAGPPVSVPRVVGLGALVILEFVVVTVLGAIFATGNWRLILFLFSLIAPSLTALFGAFTFRSDWRDSITAGFVTAYLLLVLCSVALDGFGVNANTDNTIRSVLLPNFTGLMAVVMTFYFGSEGAIQVAKALLAGKVAEANANAATGNSSGGGGSGVTGGGGSTPSAGGTVTAQTTTTTTTPA